MQVQSILQAEKLIKFSKEKYILDNVSFEVYPGEVLGLIGPAGSGKSSVVKALMGLTKMQDGAVLVDGINIKDNRVDCLKMIGSVIEKPSFYSSMSGYSNLKYFASLMQDVSKERVDEVLIQVGIDQATAKKLINSYTPEELQKLALAGALLSSPKILILDDITKGMDFRAITEFKKLLRRIVASSTTGILITTRSIEEAETMCDRIAIMHEGKILKISSIEQMDVTTVGQDMVTKYAISVANPFVAGQTISKYFKTVKYETVGSKLVINTTRSQIQEVYKAFLDKDVVIISIEQTSHSSDDLYNEIVKKYS